MSDERSSTYALLPKGAIGLAVPYGFVIASIYLSAYWGYVGLNPFHYANAADLTSATMGAISVFLLFLAFLGILGIYLNPLLGSFSQKLVDTAIRRSALSRWLMLIVPILLLIGLFALMVWRDQILQVIVMTGFIVAVIFLVIAGIVEIRNPVHQRRVAIAMVLFAFAPPLVWEHGRSSARSAADTVKGAKLDVLRSKLGFDTKGTVMYFGMLGDFHVLREVDTRATLLVPKGQGLVFISPSTGRGTSNDPHQSIETGQSAEK